jgi:predicted nuclease of predicted toxin-antitoxin system
MPRKVLLDENLPHKLRSALATHHVMTVSYQGWMGLADDRLLDMAERAGFEVLLTADQNLRHQQNMRGRQIGLVTLSTLNWTVLRGSITVIAAAISRAGPGTTEFVDLGSG